jgi:hypothetical protein
METTSAWGIWNETKRLGEKSSYFIYMYHYVFMYLFVTKLSFNFRQFIISFYRFRQTEFVSYHNYVEIHLEFSETYETNERIFQR